MHSLHKLGSPGLERIGTHLELNDGRLAHWDLNSSPDYKMLCCLYPDADSGYYCNLSNAIGWRWHCDSSAGKCGRKYTLSRPPSGEEKAPFIIYVAPLFAP